MLTWPQQGGNSDGVGLGCAHSDKNVLRFGAMPVGAQRAQRVGPPNLPMHSAP